MRRWRLWSILWVIVLPLTAQQLSVQLQQLQPPTPFLSDWEKIPFFQATIRNTAQQSQQFYIELEFKNNHTGERFTTISYLLTLLPQQMLVLNNTRQGAYGLINWRQSVRRNQQFGTDFARYLLTGIIPEGTYTICGRLLASNGIDEIQQIRPCLTVVIQHPPQPRIVFPGKGDYVSHKLPSFAIQWVATPPLGTQQQFVYRLKMVEVLPSQSPEQALQSGRAVFTTEVVQQRQYLYVAGKDPQLTPYSTYALEVQQGYYYNNRFVPIGQNQGKSPPVTFIYGERLGDITIVAPQKGALIATQQLPLKVQWQGPVLSAPIAYQLLWAPLSSGAAPEQLEHLNPKRRIVTPKQKGSLYQAELTAGDLQPVGRFALAVRIVRRIDQRVLAESAPVEFSIVKLEQPIHVELVSPQDERNFPLPDFPITVRWRINLPSLPPQYFYRLRWVQLPRDMSKAKIRQQYITPDLLDNLQFYFVSQEVRAQQVGGKMQVEEFPVYLIIKTKKQYGRFRYDPSTGKYLTADGKPIPEPHFVWRTKEGEAPLRQWLKTLNLQEHLIQRYLAVLRNRKTAFENTPKGWRQGAIDAGTRLSAELTLEQLRKTGNYLYRVEIVHRTSGRIAIASNPQFLGAAIPLIWEITFPKRDPATQRRWVDHTKYPKKFYVQWKTLYHGFPRPADFFWRIDIVELPTELTTLRDAFKNLSKANWISREDTPLDSAEVKPLRGKKFVPYRWYGARIVGIWKPLRGKEMGIGDTVYIRFLYGKPPVKDFVILQPAHQNTIPLDKLPLHVRWQNKASLPQDVEYRVEWVELAEPEGERWWKTSQITSREQLEALLRLFVPNNPAVERRHVQSAGRNLQAVLPLSKTREPYLAIRIQLYGKKLKRPFWYTPIVIVKLDLPEIDVTSPPATVQDPKDLQTPGRLRWKTLVDWNSSRTVLHYRVTMFEGRWGESVDRSIQRRKIFQRIYTPQEILKWTARFYDPNKHGKLKPYHFYGYKIEPLLKDSADKQWYQFGKETVWLFSMGRLLDPVTLLAPKDSELVADSEVQFRWKGDHQKLPNWKKAFVYVLSYVKVTGKDTTKFPRTDTIKDAKRRQQLRRAKEQLAQERFFKPSKVEIIGSTDTSFTLYQSAANDASLLLARIEIRRKRDNTPVAWSRTVEIRWKERFTAPGQEKADTIPLPIKAIAYLVLPHKDVVQRNSGKSGVKIYTTKKPVPLYIPALRFLFKGNVPKVYVSFKDAWIDFKTFQIVKGRIFAGVNPDQVQSNKDYQPLLKIGSFPISIAAVEYRAYDKKDKQAKEKPKFFVSLGLQIPGLLDRPIFLKDVTVSKKGLEGKFSWGTYSKTHNAKAKPILKWEVIKYGGLWFTLDGIEADFATGDAPEKWKFRLSGDIGSHLFVKVEKSTELPKPLHYFATLSLLPKNEVKANFGLDFSHFAKDSLTKKAKIPFGLFDFIPMTIGKQPAYEFTLDKSRFTFRLAGMLSFPFLGEKARVTIRRCTFDSKDGISFDAGARSGQTFEVFGFRWILKPVQPGQDPLLIQYDSKKKEFAVTLGGELEAFGHKVQFSGLTFSNKKGPQFGTITLLPKPLPLVKKDWLVLEQLNIIGPGGQEGKPVEFEAALRYRIPFYSKYERFRLRIATDGTMRGGHHQVLFDEPSQLGNQGDWTEISIDSLLTLDMVYFDAKLDFVRQGERRDIAIALRSVFDIYLGAPENRLSLGKRQRRKNRSSGIVPGFELVFNPLQQKVDYHFGSITQDKPFAKPIPIIPKLLSLKDFQLVEGKLPSKDKDSLRIVFGGNAVLEAGKAVESSLRLENFTVTNKGVEWDNFRVRAGRLSVMNVFVAEVANIQYNTKPEQFTAVKFVDNPQEVFKNNQGTLPTQQTESFQVEKYLTFTVKELSLNIGGAKVFRGALKKFQYYRTKNDGVSILVQGAELHFGAKDVLSVAADFEYTHIPQQQTAMLMAGKLAVLKKIELVAFGKVKTEFDATGAVSKTRLGFYCAAAFGDPGIPLGGGVFIGALGGGFFYNPEQSDINTIKQLSGLADHKLARDKFKDLVKNPALNPNAGSFALLLFGGIVIGSKALVKTQSLLTLSANYFELVGKAEFLGQGESIAGGVQVLVQWQPHFAMEGNAYVVASVAKIVNADGRLGFFVYPDAWAIFAALQVGVFKTPNSKAFGLDGTARFFIGSPGFLLELNVGLNANFWIVSISAGLDLSVWYFVQKSYGAYFSVWIEAQVAGGIVAKARGELMAAMVSMRKGSGWDWFVYGEASLSISVVMIINWKGSVYALYGNTRPFQAGFGSNPQMRALIAKARGKAAKMAQQVAKIKQKVQRKVVGKLFKYDEQTLAKAFQTYFQKVEAQRKTFVRQAIAKELQAFRQMTGLSGKDYVVVRTYTRGGSMSREFRILSEDKLKQRLDFVTKTYWNPTVPKKIRYLKQTLAKNRQTVQQWEQRYRSIARKAEQTLTGILRQLPNANYQEKRAATIRNPLRNVQLPTSTDTATLKQLLRTKQIGFSYDQAVLRQNERSASEGEQFAKKQDPQALVQYIRQYYAFLQRLDSAVAAVEDELSTSFLRARNAIIDYYLDAIWSAEYAYVLYGQLLAKTAVGDLVNQWFRGYKQYVEAAVDWRANLPDPSALKDVVTWRFRQIGMLSGNQQAFAKFQSLALKYPLSGADWAQDSADYLWWGREYEISGKQFWYGMPKAFYDQQRRRVKNLLSELAVYRAADLMLLERRQAEVTKQLDAIYDAQLELVELLWDMVDYQLYLLEAYKSAGQNPYAKTIGELRQLRQQLEWRLRVPRITRITAEHRQQGPNLIETRYRIDYAVPDRKSAAYHYNCCGGSISYDISNLWLGKIPTLGGWKIGYDPNWGIRVIDYLPTVWNSVGNNGKISRTVKFRVRIPGGYAFSVKATFAVPVVDSGRYDFERPKPRQWWQAQGFENQRTESRPPVVEVYQPIPPHNGTTPQLPPSPYFIQQLRTLQPKWRSGQEKVYVQSKSAIKVRWQHPASDVIEYSVAVAAWKPNPVMVGHTVGNTGMQQVQLGGSSHIGLFSQLQLGLRRGGVSRVFNPMQSGTTASKPIWGWQSMGGRTETTLRHVPLQHSRFYVVQVQAKTLGGGLSPVGVSSPILIDDTPPQAIDPKKVKVYAPSRYGSYYERLLYQWVRNEQNRQRGGGGLQPAFQPVVVPNAYIVTFPAMKNADRESGVLGVFVKISEREQERFGTEGWYFVDGGEAAKSAFIKATKRYDSSTPLYIHLCVVNAAGVPSKITTVRAQ